MTSKDIHVSLSMFLSFFILDLLLYPQKVDRYLILGFTHHFTALAVSKYGPCKVRGEEEEEGEILEDLVHGRM